LNNNFGDSSGLFMAIHSYKTSFAVPDFLGIDTNRILNTQKYLNVTSAHNRMKIQIKNQN
jgi:hypothetical protein